MPDWPALAAKLKTATGPDAGLDAVIAEAFGAAPAGYTESVSDCRALVGKVLPGWRLHLGFDASGVTPYAIVSNGDHRAEAAAPTVPLAILRALMDLAARP